MQIWQTTNKSGKTKERKLLQGRGGTWEGLLWTKSPWEETKNLKYSGFHWLNCAGLSLTELLPGQEKKLSLVGGSNVTSHERCKVPSLPAGICIDFEWELLLWPLDSNLVRSPFIYLHSPKSHIVNSRTGIQSQVSTSIITIILLKYSLFTILC